MADAGNIDIPILWLSLEHAAETLIFRACGGGSNATFEYRAARDVLALTLLIRGHTASTLAEDSLKLIRPQLADDSEWFKWCSSTLESVLADLSEANRGLARNAWRWLAGNRMLIDSTSSFPCASSSTDGCRVGAEQARRIVDHVLAMEQ